MASLFDKAIDRQQYPTMKWDSGQIENLFGNPDALPFWVADMDFEAPPAIVEALTARAEHGIYGYEYRPDNFMSVIVSWYHNRHNWQIDPTHIEQCPSVLNAITVLIDQNSDAGDGVIIQPPVFFEFGMVIKANGRKRVKNPLKLVDGKYEIDFDDLEAKCADPKNKILILCNPHNPVGRVWTKAELKRVARICEAHNVMVLADEIHADIIYGAHQFTPFLTVSDKGASCLSPAKTFNIAGMVDALVVIPDTDIREQYHDFAHRFQINKTNVFTSAAVEAGYSHSGQWVDDLLVYLQANIDFIRSYLADNIPQVKLIEPEGTYLVWLDFNGLGLGVKELMQFLTQEADIAVNAGHWFGREGAGFARMNIACPRITIENALSQLRDAINKT